MNYYKLIQPFLFLFPEETAHHLAIWALRNNLLPKSSKSSNHNSLETKLWGINFKNPVGLAAGFDKNGEGIKCLLNQGFGFIDTGTVTVSRQKGNPRPRLFRLKEDKAIINKMGHNNHGLESYLKKIKKWKESDIGGVVGTTICKDNDSTHDIEDNIKLLNELYNFSSYITLNVSCPNTPNPREQQKEGKLNLLLKEVGKAKKELKEKTKKDVPILVKIAPDIDKENRKVVAETIIDNGMDGIIVTNTSMKLRENLKNFEYAAKEGGLSGKPIFDLSTEVLRDIYPIAKGKIPLIGVGGIFTGDDAYKKIRSGASLVQLYTALIYEGFGVVDRINDRLAELLERDGFNSIEDAVGVDIN